MLFRSLVTPEPKKKPKASYIRFQAEQPNETWQADFTHWRLADGTDTEILTWLDDHSRYALSVTAHPRVTVGIVLQAFRTATDTYGTPFSTLTDNGMVFTTRFSGGKGGRKIEFVDLKGASAPPPRRSTTIAELDRVCEIGRAHV